MKCLIYFKKTHDITKEFSSAPEIVELYIIHYLDFEMRLWPQVMSAPHIHIYQLTGNSLQLHSLILSNATCDLIGQPMNFQYSILINLISYWTSMVII
jgi:hypothetical protein